MKGLDVGKVGARRFVLPRAARDLVLADLTPESIERFWSNVEKTGDCWLWRGYTKAHGYGRLEVLQRPVYAHRFSYALHYGAAPAGFAVCHHCDTPPCVRPGHLFLASQADNVADMQGKGRARKVGTRGFQNGNATLTDGEVAAIRLLGAQGLGQRQIAARFGCSQSTVWRILRGATRALSMEEGGVA